MIFRYIHFTKLKHLIFPNEGGRYYTPRLNEKRQVRDGKKTQNRGMHHERVRRMDGRTGKPVRRLLH
jgi:hypothetical protein